MAEMYYKIGANWEELEKARERILSLREELSKVNPNDTKSFENIRGELNLASESYGKLLAAAVASSNSVQGANDAIGQSLDGVSSRAAAAGGFFEGLAAGIENAITNAFAGVSTKIDTLVESLENISSSLEGIADSSVSSIGRIREEAEKPIEAEWSLTLGDSEEQNRYIQETREQLEAAKNELAAAPAGTEEYEQAAAKVAAYEESLKALEDGLTRVKEVEGEFSDDTAKVVEEQEKAFQVTSKSGEVFTIYATNAEQAENAMRLYEEAYERLNAAREASQDDSLTEFSTPEIGGQLEKLSEIEEKLKDVNSLADVVGEGRDFGVFNDISSLQETIDKIQELNEAVRNSSEEANTDNLDPWRAQLQSVEELSAAAEEYSQKAASLQEELRAGIGDLGGASPEGQAAIQDELRAKIDEYGNSVISSSAAASAAYEQQQEAVAGLEEHIEQLNVALAEAIAKGDENKISAIASEIANASTMLEDARNGLDVLKEAAVEASGEVDNLAASQENFALSVENGGQTIGQRIDEAKEALAGYASEVGNALTGNGQFQESLAGLKGAFSMLPAPITSSFKAAKVFTAQLWKMAATPIGAVLTAIVLALQGLFKWFNKSAEGQKAFAKISAYVGSILSSLTDILVKVGEYLFNAFTKPNGAMKSFTDGLVTSFKSAIESVSNALSGLGDLLGGVWKMLKGDFKEGFEQIKSGGVQVGKAFKGVFVTAGNSLKAVGSGLVGLVNMAADGVVAVSKINLSDAFNSVFSKADEAAELAGRQLELEQKMRDAKDEEAALDRQIAENREKIFTLTGKEKDALIEQTKALQKQKFDKQISNMREQYEIQKGINSLHTTSIEDLAKEQGFRREIVKLEARQAASTRMLTRMQASNQRSMARQAASQAKNAGKQSEKVKAAEGKLDEVLYTNEQAREKAETALEQRIADAKIKAMKDGAERVRQEKERELDKELGQLDQQFAAALDAEEKRQKKEYDAQNAVRKARGEKVATWDRDTMFDETTDEVKKIKEQFAKLKNLIIEAHVRITADKQEAAMNAYLKAYGNLQEQRAAIAAEYDKKIAEAQTEGDKLRIKKEKQKALETFDNAPVKALNDYFLKYGNLAQQREAQSKKFQLQLQEEVGGQEAYNKLLEEAGDDQEKFIQLAVQKGAKEGVVRSILAEQAEVIADIDNKMNGVSTVIQRINGDLSTKTTKYLTELAKKAKTLRDAFTNSASYEDFKGKAGDAGLGITEKEYNAIKKDPDKLKALAEGVDKAADAANKAKGPFSTIASAMGKLFGKKSEKDIKDGTAKWKDGFQDITGAVGQLSKAFSFVGGAVKDFYVALGGDELSDAAEAIGAVSGALDQAAAGAQVGAMFGAYGALIGAVAGAAVSVVSSLSEISEKRHDKRIKELADKIDDLKDKYNDLGDAIDRAYSKDAAQLIEQQNALLRQQKLLVQQQLQEEKSKKNADKDKIRSYKKTLDEIDKQIEDNKESAIDAIFGQDVKSAIDGFANAYANAWEQGNNKAKSARDYVKKMIKGMIQEAMKADVSAPMEKLREKMLAFWSDNVITDVERAQLNQMAERIQEDLDKKYAWADGLMTSADESGQGTSGGFATIGQESADELNGRFSAVQILAERGLLEQRANGEKFSILNATAEEIGNNVLGIRNIADDLREYSVSSFLELKRINENTSKTALHLGAIRTDIAEIKRKTDNL